LYFTPEPRRWIRLLTTPPPYCKLNPDEGVWSLTKRKLANGRPDNKEDLLRQVNNALIDIRRSSAKLRGCIVQSDLPSFLR